MAQTAVLSHETVQLFLFICLLASTLYAGMEAHMHICSHVCMYGGTSAYMFACMHVWRHICIYARMYACIKAHMHICSHVCMCGGICVTFLFQNFIVHFRGGLKLCPPWHPPKIVMHRPPWATTHDRMIYGANGCSFEWERAFVLFICLLALTLYACMEAHVHICSHVCMYGGTSAYMLACMHVWRHICIYARMYACIKAQRHICIYARMYACVEPFVLLIYCRISLSTFGGV